MKGKGYRSSSVKAIWIVIAHLAAVAAAVCAAMFVMIYRLESAWMTEAKVTQNQKHLRNRSATEDQIFWSVWQRRMTLTI